MAYTTFTGKDGAQANFPWVTQKVGGIDAMVFVLDVGGNPASSANPVPVTAPGNIPISVGASPGTLPVSVAATVSTVTPTDAAPIGRGSNAALTTASVQLAAQNLSRKRIEISNWSTTAQIAVRFGSSAAVIGQDLILPPQAQATYYTTAEVRVIASAASTGVSYVEW